MVMNLFQKKIVPKKLSIKETWTLYNLLKSGLKDTVQEYLVDEILSVMEGIDTESFKQSLRIIYGDAVDYGSKSPIDLALMFTQGLKKNNILNFPIFIKALSR